jgi:hypothetical protein
MGAGLTIDEAVGIDRWRRELVQDFHLDPEAAGRIVAELKRELSSDPSLAGVRERLITLSDEVIPMPSTNHVVYRLYDAIGVLLYVGVTDRWPQRALEHYRSKSWAADVARWEISRWPERSMAEWAERDLIRRLRPLWNIQHA